MSSLCWSLPHLLSSSPKHEAPPGQHDLLQDDTVHRKPLPKTTWSASNAKEPLSHINCESGGNLRTDTPTGCEPKELATTEFATILTISGSSLEDIYQLFRCTDIESGEQDQQAPIVEEGMEFGQILAQSLLDREMADMSLLQSQMHFDDFVESIADSDPEDGEIEKLLTSSLYAQRASGKCTSVSFIRRSKSSQETGCIVFTKT